MSGLVRHIHSDKVEGEHPVIQTSHVCDTGERAGPVQRYHKQFASNEPVRAFRVIKVSRGLVSKHAMQAVFPCESGEPDPLSKVLQNLDAGLLQRRQISLGRRVHIGAMSSSYKKYMISLTQGGNKFDTYSYPI